MSTSIRFSSLMALSIFLLACGGDPYDDDIFIDSGKAERFGYKGEVIEIIKVADSYKQARSKLEHKDWDVINLPLDQKRILLLPTNSSTKWTLYNYYGLKVKSILLGSSKYKLFNAFLVEPSIEEMQAERAKCLEKEKENCMDLRANFEHAKLGELNLWFKVVPPETSIVLPKEEPGTILLLPGNKHLMVKLPGKKKTHKWEATEASPVAELLYQYRTPSEDNEDEYSYSFVHQAPQESGTTFELRFENEKQRIFFLLEVESDCNVSVDNLVGERIGKDLTRDVSLRKGQTLCVKLLAPYKNEIWFDPYFDRKDLEQQKTDKQDGAQLFKFKVLTSLKKNIELTILSQNDENDEVDNFVMNLALNN